MGSGNAALPATTALRSSHGPVRPIADRALGQVVRRRCRAEGFAPQVTGRGRRARPRGAMDGAEAVSPPSRASGSRAAQAGRRLVPGPADPPWPPRRSGREGGTGRSSPRRAPWARACGAPAGSGLRSPGARAALTEGSRSCRPDALHAGRPGRLPPSEVRPRDRPAPCVRHDAAEREDDGGLRGRMPWGGASADGGGLTDAAALPAPTGSWRSACTSVPATGPVSGGGRGRGRGRSRGSRSRRRRSGRTRPGRPRR